MLPHPPLRTQLRRYTSFPKALATLIPAFTAFSRVEGPWWATLIDKSDTFVFGFSKLDVMFGRRMPADVRHRYSDIVKPGQTGRPARSQMTRLIHSQGKSQAPAPAVSPAQSEGVLP
jgi:hypothetical protein